MPDMKEIFNFLGRGLARVTEQCRIPGCNAHSLGFICRTCTRYVCQTHAYATMPGLRQPEVICASCIIDKHEDLLDDVEPPEPPRARASNGHDHRSSESSHQRDPNVVDAEYERVK